MKRRGWTLRVGQQVFRVTKPSHRVRFGGRRRPSPQVSLGWLIVTKL